MKKTPNRNPLFKAIRTMAVRYRTFFPVFPFLSRGTISVVQAPHLCAGHPVGCRQPVGYLMPHPIDTDATPMQGFPAMCVGLVSFGSVRLFLPWVISVPLLALRACGYSLVVSVMNCWSLILADAVQTGLLSMKCSTSNIVKKST